MYHVKVYIYDDVAARAGCAADLTDKEPSTQLTSVAPVAVVASIGIVDT